MATSSVAVGMMLSVREQITFEISNIEDEECKN